MPLTLVQTVAPAVEPLLVSELAAWLRVDADDTSQNDVLTHLAADVRRRCETVSGRALITQTWRLSLDGFPPPSGYFGSSWWVRLDRPDGDGPGVWPWKFAIRLPKPPVQSVTSIVYVDQAGATQTLAASAYQVDTDSDPARIVPAYSSLWPVARPQLNAVQVTFVAGYGATGASVPDDMRGAMKIAAAHLYENRAKPDEDFLDRLFRPFWRGELL